MSTKDDEDDASDHHGDDDAALVRATLAGDTGAFARLYDRYAPVVRAVCHDATDRDLAQAQDLAQETFLRAYRKLGGLRRAECFGPWVVGVARHVCREWRRGAGRRRRHLRAVMDLADSRQLHASDNGHAVPGDERGHDSSGVADAGPGDVADDDLRRLRDAIAALPPREREALHALYLSERPADDAARLVGLSRSGFYRAIDRAKRRLRELLGRAGVSTPTPVSEPSGEGPDANTKESGSSRRTAQTPASERGVPR